MLILKQRNTNEVTVKTDFEAVDALVCRLESQRSRLVASF